MRLNFAQVVGQPSERLWSQVVVLGVRSIKSTVVGTETGGVLVVCLTVRDGEAAADKGKETVSQLEAWASTRGGWKEAGELWQGLNELKLGEVEVVGVGVSMGKMILFGIDRGRVLLAREGKTGQVFEAISGKWSMREGKLQTGDRLLIGTEGLAGEMSKGLMEEVLGYERVGEAGEDLAARVQAAEENADAAGGLIWVEDDDGEKVEAEVRGESRQTPDITGETEKIKPTVYLKSVNKKQKMAVSIGIVLLVLLGVSIGLGRQQLTKSRYEGKFAEVWGQVSDKEEKAKVTQADNPLEAKKLITEAQGIVAEAMKEFEGQDKWYKQLEDKAAELKLVYTQVSGEVAVEAEVWYELSLIREGMYGTRVDISGDQMYVLDNTLGVVGVVGLNNKQGSLAAGGNLLTGARLMDIAGVRGAVMAEAGVVEANVRDKTTEVMVKAEAEWGKLTGVGMYSGNVYLLDTGKSEVWRYPAIEQGVGGRQRWLQAGYTPDLSQMVDMVIDGDVWLVGKGGQILRLRRGAKEAFEITGLDGGWGEVTAIDTNEDMDSIYLLDRGKTRVVKIGKDGKYSQQYVWQGLAAAEDMAVDSGGGRLMVLVGRTIYQIKF